MLYLLIPCETENLDTDCRWEYFCSAFSLCRKQFASLSFQSHPSCTHGKQSPATVPQEELWWRSSSCVQHAPSTRSKLPYRCSTHKFQSDAPSILPTRKSKHVPSSWLLCPRWAQVDLSNFISECKTVRKNSDFKKQLWFDQNWLLCSIWVLCIVSLSYIWYVNVLFFFFF